MVADIKSSHILIELERWMAALGKMPKIVVDKEVLEPFGITWREHDGALSRTPPNSSSQLGEVFDKKVGEALSVLLGGIPLATPKGTSLLPTAEDCVEVGPFRVVGGIRPQNFDVGYRPDGVRIAFDSKTLNDGASVRKNYQNMINDLGTEASTVHTRCPYAVVAFMVIVPDPCLNSPQREALTETLERLTRRLSPLDSVHKAESIALVVWNPGTGEISMAWPDTDSPLRIEKFSEQIEVAYRERFKGLPPHNQGE